MNFDYLLDQLVDYYRVAQNEVTLFLQYLRETYGDNYTQLGPAELDNAYTQWLIAYLRS